MPLRLGHQELKDKKSWPKKSVGQKMTDKVPTVLPSFTLADVHSLILSNIKKFETINYIYVLDDANKLIGVFSIKDLYRLPARTKVKSVIRKEGLVSFLPTAHQEQVAYAALKHNIKAIPVVDKNNVFQGVVPSDKILSILYKELREDIFYLAGIERSHIAFDNILDIPLFKALKHRLPWLFVGSLGGILAAYVVGHFKQTLEKNLILAAFIPLIVYIADAVGTQLEAFTIRDLAIFRKLDCVRYFLKQLSIVFSMALLLGGGLILLIFALSQSFNIALVIGLAIIGAVMSALFTGIMIPILFRNFKLDPANASGPIGTIIQDILSVLIYLLIASWLLP